MRIATVDGRAALARDGSYLDVAAASAGRFGPEPLGVYDAWEAFLTWADATGGAGDWQPLDERRLGPPVPLPRQVFALALNYVDHAAEAGLTLPEQPYVFTKFPTCITGPFDDVLLPGNRVDWEVELVVVIGRRAHRVAAADAWAYVAGVTVGQDVSERRVQFRKPMQHLAAGKSFPTFGPTGPWVVTPDELPDRDDLRITCSVNGEPMQDGRTGQMVFGVAAVVEAISATTVLLPGDLVFTGTPAGVGSTRDPRRYLAPGDVILSEIEGVGALRNTCATSP